MIHHRLRLCWTKHSQKLAFIAGCATVGMTYILQPHYECMSRWSLARITGCTEEAPSSRIKQVTKEVAHYFQLTKEQQTQLNLFVTNVDQTIALGSILTPGYAFIGLPFFFKYADVSEIPLDVMNTSALAASNRAYSAVGQRGLELMVLPEAALHFVIARELVRLGARPSGVRASHFLPSARTRCLITSVGMVSGLYAAYQISYMANRIFRLPTRSSLLTRCLVYCLASVTGLLCQHEVALRWRSFCCYEVDRIATMAGDNRFLLDGAIAYYDWRLRWNRFWYERCSELLQQQQTPANSGGSVAATLKSQGGSSEPMNLEDMDYYIPYTGENKLQTEIRGSSVCNPRSTSDDACSKSVDATTSLSPDRLLDSREINPWFSSTGRERWLGDGDALHFGLTDILSMGLLPGFITSFLVLFIPSVVADSHSRLQKLNQLMTERVG